MRHRLAFTLLELLLTLAIFAAMAAVVIPKLAPLLGEQNLVRAGEQLRIEMTRMRIEAMRGGRVMIVQGEVGSPTFQVKPLFSATDAIETVGGSNSQAGLLTGANQAAVVAMPIESEEEKSIELPEEVTIESIVVVSSARALQMSGQQGGEQLATDPSAASTSPILFYADGTTSTAAITLSHPTTGRITVKLRGITGDVTVGEVTASKVDP